MLNMEIHKTELLKNIEHALDSKRKDRFNVAFRSLDYQSSYCSYHYEEFKSACDKHWQAMRGGDGNPQCFRIVFESNAIAFFRVLHSMVESVPYMLNILMRINENYEHQYIGWKTIECYLEKNFYESNTRYILKELRASDSYRELENLVNITKHRRIPRIDSENFSFAMEDLDFNFRTLSVIDNMDVLYDELIPKIFSLIKNSSDEILV